MVRFMAITAAKLKRLRREQKIEERKMRDELLQRLGSDQTKLLQRLGQLKQNRCLNCDQIFSDVFPHTCKGRYYQRQRRKARQRNEREKLLKKLGIEPKEDSIRDWCDKRGLTLSGRLRRLS